MPVIAAFVLLVSLSAPASDVFARFGVRVQPVPASVSVHGRTSWTRRFRSDLALEAQHPVDFAGRYVLAQIGCGAGCLMLGAIDKRSGSVVELPQTLCCWPDAIIDPLHYRANSRLLIVQGRLNEKGDAVTHRFVLRGGRFERLPDHRVTGGK